MPKLTASLIILSALFFSSASTAQGKFDCDLLIGTWVGDYTFDDGQYSQWEALYKEDGVFSIEFFAEKGGDVVASQLGSWQCDGTWVTSTATDQGQEYSFKYQIRTLDRFRYQYESTQGPLFTSYRKSDDVQ
jgi:hypothetical protein